MIRNILDEFKVMLNDYTWMDENSKMSAKEKANKIDIQIGYPDYTYNEKYMNDLYKSVIFIFFTL